MAVVFSNNAVTTLAGSVSTSATSITVADGSVFPDVSSASDHTYITLEDVNSNREIVKLTNRSGNTLTVVRGQDGTTAQSFSSGDKVELRITAVLLNEIAAQADTDTNTEYTAGSGLNLSGTTFSNTAPDQTVSLTGSGATTISGTYPNFTISSTDTTFSTSNAVNFTNTFQLTGVLTGGHQGFVTWTNDDLRVINAKTIHQEDTTYGDAFQIFHSNGSGSDVNISQIMHVGNNLTPHGRMLIQSLGDLDLSATGTISIRKFGSAPYDMIKAIPDGAVELYYNNSKVAETVSSGFTVTGALTGTTLDINGSADISGDTLINGSGTTNATFGLRIQDSAGANIFRARNDGVVFVDKSYLYVTSSGGAYVQHSLRVRGELTNDGGNSLSINSGNSDINFNSKNLTSVGNVDGRDVSADGTKLDTIATNADVTPSWVPSSNPSYITNSTASLNANKITSGTLSNSRLSTDMQLTSNAPRYRLEESDVTNTPNWWMIADGGNYSIRLNNTGVYPLTIVTNSTNNAVSSINLGYATHVQGNITLTGTVDGRDIATDGTKLDTIATNADVTPSWVPSSNPNYLTSHQSLSGYATESYVGTAISNLVDSAPSTLDTLNELAAALGDDANFSTTITTSIGTKLPLAGGTLTGTLNSKAINMQNSQLYSVNNLRFNDPGVNEGIKWDGGNEWQIYESPDNQTNNSGNLQFTTGTGNGTRRATLTTGGHWNLLTGDLQIGGDSVITSSKALQNVTGNISMFTNDSGYITSADGGNADTVDGFHVSSLMNATGTQFSSASNWSSTIFPLSSSNTLHWNSVHNSTSSWTDSPQATFSSAYTYGGVENVRLNNAQIQTYYPHTGSNGNGVYYRTGWNGSSASPHFYGWKVFLDSGNVSSYAWTSSNDGSGSGLDSDLLDGQQGSYYLNYNNFSNTPSIGNGTLTVTGAGSVSGSGTFTANQSGNTTITLTGSTDADTLDGKDHTAFGATLATYGTTGAGSGRIRCTAPFTTNSAHMFQITISLYKSYQISTYVVGGYMYPTSNQWYNAKCIFTGTENPDIIVGRDNSGYAYISIANSSYTGVRVHNMTRGYYTTVADTYDPWTITIDSGTENSVTPTVSTVWHSTNDGSGSGLDADTLDGYQSGHFATQGNLGSYLPLSGSTMTGTLKLADGSASVPSLSFGSDTDTGIYRSSSNAFGLTAGGVLRLLVDSSGGISSYNTIFARKDNVTNYTDAQVRLDSFGGASSLAGLGFHISGQVGRMLFMNSSTNLYWNSTSAVLWHASNDGSGSGLDSDLLDGQHGAYYLNYNHLTNTPSIPSVGNGTLSITTSGSVSGSGSFTANQSGNTTINITGNGIMQGTNAVGNGSFSDAIGEGFRFQRVTGGSNRATTSHHNVLQIPNTSGDIYLAQMAFGTDASNTKLAWRSKGTSFGSWYDIWHSGNDGSNSGLDADTVDGQHASAFLTSETDTLASVTARGASTSTKSNFNGGASISGTSHTRSIPTKWYGTAYSNQDIDYYEHNHAKAQLGNTYKYTTSRPAITTDTNYWVGSMGWGNTDLITVFCWGSGFWDSWSSPNNNPGGTSHWQGINALHYSANTGNTQYGMQMTMGAGNTNLMYVRGIWGSGFGSWQKMWNAGNDGSGSGLDADLLDGQQGSYYARVADIPTVGNGTLTVTTSGSASGGGTFTANQSGNTTINISATDTTANQTITLTGPVTGSGTTSISTSNPYQNSVNFGGSNGASPDSSMEYQQLSNVTDTKISPSTNWHNSIRMGHGDPYNYYSNTIAIRMTGSGLGDLYTQTISNNNAQGWNKHWHNNNDGSGSGLDADLLDGQHGSYYAAASDIPTVGNGTLTVQGAGSVSGSGTFTANQSGNTTITLTGSTDASTLDGIDSASFLRSDVSDSCSSNIITTLSRLEFTGVGTNSNTTNGSYAIYQEAGAWSHPYPDLVIAYHTGIKIGGHTAYGGTRFYDNNPTSGQIIASIGDGDNHFRGYHNGFLRHGGSTDHKLITTGNDGSGSGLDADLLDGQQGSYYYSPANPPPGGGGSGSFNGGTVTGNTFFNTNTIKVGIRTGSPAAALDVNGTIKAQSLNVNDKLLMVAQPTSTDQGYVQSDAYGHGGHFGHYIENGIYASDGNQYTIGDINSVTEYTAGFGRFGKIVEDVRVRTVRLTFPSYNWLYTYPKLLVEVPYFQTQIKPILQILSVSVFVDMLNGQTGGAGLTNSNHVDIFQVGYWRDQQSYGSASQNNFQTFKPVFRFPKGIYNANLKDATGTPANFYYAEMERDPVNGGVAYPDHDIFLSSNTHDWGNQSSNQNSMVFTLKVRYKLIHPSGDFNSALGTTYGGG